MISKCNLSPYFFWQLVLYLYLKFFCAQSLKLNSSCQQGKQRKCAGETWIYCIQSLYGKTDSQVKPVGTSSWCQIIFGIVYYSVLVSKLGRFIILISNSYLIELLDILHIAWSNTGHQHTNILIYFIFFKHICF